jgi:glutamate/tyrosine decarboxylase-like PLP-dependent enzyme
MTNANIDSLSLPRTTVRTELLERTLGLAQEFLDRVDERHVGTTASYSELLAAMGGPLPATGEDPIHVIEELARNADPGLVATPGPRYFGFVIGGSLPAAVAADWLTSTWDQNAAAFVLSPAAAVAEEVSRAWLADLLGLSPDMSLGFPTGATMANFVGVAAARHALLARVGWDVEERGLFGAPEIDVLTSDESHVSLFASLQMLGLGRSRVTRIATDAQGRMRADALRERLATATAPVLVCAQAGNVNTGAFDPLVEISAAVREVRGWLHVDAAFGGWAAASPRFRALARGLENADSVCLDAHKWLNVPYDCGLVFVRDREAHFAAMMLDAPYYAPGPDAARSSFNWVPEASRRARGFAVYAALRSLGRDGAADLVDRCCDLALRMATRLGQEPGIQILNDVVLNQVLVRFLPHDGGDADALTRDVIARVQADGTCWLGGTTWHGMHAMRIAVSNWSTTEADADLSAEAIIRCAAAANPSE